MDPVLIRGGGDLGSGVALRLQRCGFRIIITELPNPLAVRRTVCFSEAIYTGEAIIEGLRARLAETAAEAIAMTKNGIIPVLADPFSAITKEVNFSALIDARLLKRRSDTALSDAALVIGLGPGFICRENCHAVVETQRGHNLGRVYWDGAASEDTGQPEGDPRRVLRAPADGILIDHAQIGDHIKEGQIIAEIAGQPILAPFAGVLRGLIRPVVPISKGMKIGDIDVRNDPSFCFTVSDKALAVGGGVLEAYLSQVTHS